MNINQNFTSIQAHTVNKKAELPSFGKKYPYEDIMSIVSGGFNTNMDRLDKTIADILGKKVGNQLEKTVDYFRARKLINDKYPELKKASDSLYQALTSVNPNHFAIPKDKVAEIIEKQSQKYGNKFIDIEI